MDTKYNNNIISQIEMIGTRSNILRFYKIFWIYKSLPFLKHFLNSNQNTVHTSNMSYIFSLIWTKTQRCTPSICARSICELIRTLQCMLKEIQPGHEVEYFLRFYQILWIYKSLSFWQFSINSNQNTTLHTFHMCPVSLWIDNNTPIYALGDKAWTRDRIFTKTKSNFINLQKSVVLTIFHQFDKKKPDVAHLQYLLFPYTDG